MDYPKSQYSDYYKEKHLQALLGMRESESNERNINRLTESLPAIFDLYFYKIKASHVRIQKLRKSALKNLRK